MATLATEGLPLLLVLARVLPLGLALATLTRGWIPWAIALSLCLSLAVALRPIAGAGPAWAGAGQLLLWLLRELCIGGTFALALGLALLATSWSIRMSQSRDTRAAVDSLSQSYVLCAIWLVLALGGLRAIVIGLAESFSDAPLAAGLLSGRTFALGTAQLVVDAFATAWGFALPLLVSVWLLELSGALIARLLFAGGSALGPLLSPLLLLIAAVLLLGPIATEGPASVRSAIAAARALTRALAR
jgi:flagellar biosynthesis protein FliR